MGAIDTLLKATIIVAVAVVSTAVAYHYVIYIPERDAALDAGRRTEAERIRKTQAEQQERAAAQQAEQERRTAAEKYEADQLKQQISVRYERCNLNAEVNYNADWNSTCARVNELQRKNYDDCLSKKFMTKEICDGSYKITTKPEGCTLPRTIADGLNTDLARAKDRCLKEFQLGFH